MQPFSDEDASIETLSHCSSFSDNTSVADEGRFLYLLGYVFICNTCAPVLFELVSTHPGDAVSLYLFGHIIKQECTSLSLALNCAVKSLIRQTFEKKTVLVRLRHPKG